MFEQTRHELLRELDMDVLDQQSTTQLQDEYRQLMKENVSCCVSNLLFSDTAKHLISVISNFRGLMKMSSLRI